ncbi:Methyltransferase domain-containing protein [Arboricoccus pini]|uniref:Methyltransferase domain-containing protein n=1 Tax=Arboricoccus pini TaxID=1963835 RepID=A0A212R0X9_9PROT|nr:class I SAM-dependent methyltransferase [Arboricoccus pini]SNB65591.1 Methyltransferase domain-containing protein [Arboricoccus pini]
MAIRQKLQKFIGVKGVRKQLGAIQAALAAQEVLAIQEALAVRTVSPTADAHEPAPSTMGVDINSLRYADVMGRPGVPASPPTAIPLTSGLCTQSDFARDAHRYWIAAIDLPLVLHRKHWEFYFIIQALHERGYLVPGNRGLGFGVGTEPLPALFAAHGCSVVATDQAAAQAVESGWTETNQHASSLLQLRRPKICPDEELERLVQVREADMNDIPRDLDGSFDFCWSACCFEHLGSLAAGADFVENSLRTLRPGGIAVHTTEFNLSSNEDTLETPPLSLFRKRDIEALASRLETQGHHVAPIDWNRGDGLLDGHVDLPPFSHEPHLRVRLAEYDCTSIGLIVTRKA